MGKYTAWGYTRPTCSERVSHEWEGARTWVTPLTWHRQEARLNSKPNVQFSWKRPRQAQPGGFISLAHPRLLLAEQPYCHLV